MHFVSYTSGLIPVDFSLKDSSMEKTWKPKGWLAVIIGFVLQPFVFLYVNRPRLFWLYSFIATVVLVLSMKSMGNINDEDYSPSYYWFVAVMCVAHGYWCTRNYDVSRARAWYAGGFAVIGIVFSVFVAISLVRAIFIEPYQIPAASMNPLLQVGDHILVKKFGYGNYRTFGIGLFKTEPSNLPKRGEVFVFQHPQEPHIDYVKRIIGMPGDTIIFKWQTLYIQRACDNGDCKPPEKVQQSDTGITVENDWGVTVNELEETLGGETYRVLVNHKLPSLTSHFYTQVGQPVGQWVVPAGHYFVLGDNRDNSRDSRFWGFVPQQYILGKVVYIW